jgi:4-hydroxybenzoate polyprenyltransferase
VTSPAGSGPPPAVREPGAVGTLKVFAELVKFEHSIFALPFAYVGALYGAASLGPLVSSEGGLELPANAWVTLGGWPTFLAMLWITVAMVTARAFAFVVNRAVDKEIDARNPRTAGRAVPAGIVKARELWVFSAVTLVVFLVAVWQLHPVTRWLWPIVLAAFVVYPYTKRFTWLCHYWLGMCLGLAPVGAWTAVTGDPLAPPAYVLGTAVLVWTAGFDIIYATQDIECDVRDGIHSVPARFGVAHALQMTRADHIFAIGLLVLFGFMAATGWPWYVGVGVAAALLAYENAIVSADDLSRVNAAFFTVNGIIAMVVFTGALVDRLLA